VGKGHPFASGIDLSRFQSIAGDQGMAHSRTDAVPVVTVPLLVDRAFVEELRYQMEACWRDLALAESRGLPQLQIDRLYATYLLAFRAYDAAAERLAQFATLQV
jgi:hypothetical protein